MEGGIVANNSFHKKAYTKMLDWKASLAGKYALLVEGARRVGKTHLIREFVANEYESSIYIDFSQKGSAVAASKRAFAEEDDVRGVIERLSIIHGARLSPDGASCLVFDEVQRFPAAREMIKALMEHGRYHCIESGSLVGIKENVRDIVIPSEEHSMKLHPLDFDEFLEALGETPLRDAMRDAFAAGRPLGEDAHQKAMRLFRVYMVVGGMPQSVAAYIDGGDGRLEASERAKREILSLYEKDIGKYARGYASKVRAIFRNIPSALNTREKKFRLAALGANARMRRYEDSFLWLADAMVANMAYNATSPDVGLGMNVESSLFKCYSLDTGLLLTQAMAAGAGMGAGNRVDGRLLRGVLYDRLGVNEGMFFENAVAQALAANGHDLLFYSRKDAANAENTMEIDFLIRKGIKVVPIEVKSAKAREHASLDRFVRAFSRNLGPRYVVCTKNRFEESGLTYLPVYFAQYL